jgi:SAM-dependent methyltransferase
MTSYQSFPGKAGASQSLAKLQCLRLPNLYNRKFLDVGCNEGFFCGYAIFKNASKVVGIDQEKKFIDNAIQAFPNAQFICSSWNNLPEDSFDIILLASALHYADDQPLLIQKLMSHLSSAGTLVLEIGVSEKSGDEWVNVKRGIDERHFPTWEKLKTVLSPYAWKHVGSSISQSGDPTPRHVFHIQHLKPTAFLLLSKPGSGKSSICRELFIKKSEVTYISGDKMIHDLYTRKINSTAHKIEAVIMQMYNPLRLDKVINKICEEGLIEKYFENCLIIAKEKSFAYDGYFPKETHSIVLSYLSQKGFIPVLIDPCGRFDDYVSHAEAELDAKKYYKTLSPKSTELISDNTLFGFIDFITDDNNVIECRGWCTSYSSLVASFFLVKINGLTIRVENFQRITRQDVLLKIPTAPLSCGFYFKVAIPSGSKKINDGLQSYEVFAGAPPSNTDVFLLNKP